MKEEEMLLKQYETLRNEILETNKSSNQILIVVVGFAGTVLSFCLKEKDFYYGILSSYFVTFLAYRILYGNRKKIWRNASYMSVFIEPELKKIKWETRLNNLKEIMEPKRRNSFSSLITENEFYVVNFLNIIVLIFLVVNYFNLIYIQQPRDYKSEIIMCWVIGISIILNVIFFTWSFACNKKNERNRKNHNDFLYGWNKVKEQEFQNKTASLQG